MENKIQFAYIFPTNLEHPGLKIKYDGQLHAFQKKYDVKTVYYNYKTTDQTLIKIIKYLIFEFKSIHALVTSKRAFIRYNPKAILTNLLLPYLKSKTLFLEFNTNLNTELPLLNRSIEQKMNTFFISNFIKHNHIHYISVTNEIQETLIEQGINPKLTHYIQNGYKPPKKNNENINFSKVKEVSEFKKKFKKIGILVGNNYQWHGLDKIINLTTTGSELGLIIIGPYKKQTNKQCLFLDKQTPDTIKEIYPYCNFGIGSMNFESIQLTEACPLKTREYLSNGLPILVNYKDCAEDIPRLRPFIFNIGNNTIEDTLRTLLEKQFSHESIRTIAEVELSWEKLLKEI